MRDECDLFVGERNSAQITEGGLGQVVKQTEKELLSVALLAKLERSISYVLEEQVDTDGSDMQVAVFLLFNNPFDVGLEDTEGTKGTALVHNRLDSWQAF